MKTKTGSTVAAAPGVVMQEGRMGCGVACVAAAAGTTYKRALRFFAGLHGDDAKLGYSRRTLLEALRRAGLVYTFHTFGSTPGAREIRANLVPLGTIVFVKDSAYPLGHYLFRRRHGWMDPLHPSHRRQLPGTARSYLMPHPRTK